MKLASRSLRTALSFSALFGGLLVVGACSVGGLDIKLEPDGSGKAQFIDMNFSVRDVGDIPGFAGVTGKGRTAMSVDSMEVTFTDINQANLGGVRVKREKKGDDTTLTMSVPLDPKAPWVRALNINEASLARKRKNFQLFQEKAAKEEKGESNPMLPAMMEGLRQALDKVNLEVKLPDPVKEAKVLEPASIDISSLKAKSSGPGASQKENEVKLSVPLEMILKKQHPQLVIRIVSGPKAEPKGEEPKGDEPKKEEPGEE